MKDVNGNIISPGDTVAFSGVEPRKRRQPLNTKKYMKTGIVRYIVTTETIYGTSYCLHVEVKTPENCKAEYSYSRIRSENTVLLISKAKIEESDE